MKLNFEPYSLCALSNGNLLSCNNESLAILDKNFKIIKTITKIDAYSIFCLYATTNHKNRIFFSNSEENQVVITDLELNKIKIIGTYGRSAEQFNHPRGLTYYKNLIYICDNGNKRLQKVKDETYEFDRPIELDYCPVQIKLANDTVLVGSLFSLYFYNLNDFSLLHKYEGHNGTISEINSIFYEYFPFNKKFYCFSKNAELVEEIQTDGFNNEHNGSLAYFKDSFVLPSTDSKKLIIIDRLNN